MQAAHQLPQSIEFPLLRREGRALLARLLFLTLDLLLLTLELFLLPFDLCLLLFEGVNEDGGELVVFDAFDLAVRVAECVQRLNLLNFFSAEADVLRAVLFPSEADRAQAIDHIESAEKSRDVALVAQAG